MPWFLRTRCFYIFIIEVQQLKKNLTIRVRSKNNLGHAETGAGLRENKSECHKISKNGMLPCAWKFVLVQYATSDLENSDIHLRSKNNFLLYSSKSGFDK